MSTRIFMPGDPYGINVSVKSATGALVAADTLPTGSIYHNGTVDSAVTVTVTAAAATGVYGLTATIPSTYAPGDRVSLMVNATVGGIATGGFADHVRLTGFANTSIPNAAPGALGGLPTVDASNGVKLSVGTATGQVSLATGQVSIAQAFPANFASLAITTAGAVTPAGGSSTVTLDGGAALAGGAAMSFSAAGVNLHAPSGGYNGMAIEFQGGVLQGQRRQVALHAVAAGVHTLTLTAAFTSAPGAGDPFVLG
jgi:hypothetical protein